MRIRDAHRARSDRLNEPARPDAQAMNRNSGRPSHRNLEVGVGRKLVLEAVLDDATTINDICAAACLSPSTVLLHLRKLRTAGLVDFDDMKQGTIRPTGACKLTIDGHPTVLVVVARY